MIWPAVTRHTNMNQIGLQWSGSSLVVTALIHINGYECVFLLILHTSWEFVFQSCSHPKYIQFEWSFLLRLVLFNVFYLACGFQFQLLKIIVLYCYSVSLALIDPMKIHYIPLCCFTVFWLQLEIIHNIHMPFFVWHIQTVLFCSSSIVTALAHHWMWVCDCFNITHFHPGNFV